MKCILAKLVLDLNVSAFNPPCILLSVIEFTSFTTRKAGSTVFLSPLKKNNVEGELFMVHGRYYYHVEKKKIFPGELPKTLHWFKWEATLIWATGFLLLVALYYLRGASIFRQLQFHYIPSLARIDLMVSTV